MSVTKEKKMADEAYFMSEIYKNTKMGSDAIINLLPCVRDDAMRSAMTRQLDGYEKYAARAAKHLEEEGICPKEENWFARISARIGMAFNTMVDSTGSHIAQMMVEGSNMGVTDLTKLLNTFEPRGSATEAVRLAHEVLEFEQHNLEVMRRYL
ncbi:MAG: hypothetical protein E7624_01560 [Ruminococcaceae bacterium]|nr:hypothetical protein [Oscillospiraceae bacterium]